MAASPFSSTMFNGPPSAWIVSVSSVVDPLNAEESADSVNPFKFSEPKKYSQLKTEELVNSVGTQNITANELSD